MTVARCWRLLGRKCSHTLFQFLTALERNGNIRWEIIRCRELNRFSGRYRAFRRRRGRSSNKTPLHPTPPNTLNFCVNDEEKMLLIPRVGYFGGCSGDQLLYHVIAVERNNLDIILLKYLTIFLNLFYGIFLYPYDLFFVEEKIIYSWKVVELHFIIIVSGPCMELQNKYTFLSKIMHYDNS